MRKFVNATANGLMPLDTDEVIIFIHGPRGGQRACEAISPKEARLLGHSLIAAACAIELEAKS